MTEETKIVQCSWCKRIRMDDEWFPLEHPIDMDACEVSHGICPECAKTIDEKLARRVAV